MAVKCLVAIVLVLAGTAWGDNPFNPGTYKIAEFVVSPLVDGSPLHSTVLFPLTPGNYTPILFFGGLNGYVLSEFYMTLLSDIARHGYIVIGIDPVYPFPPTYNLQAHLKDRNERSFGGKESSLLDTYLNQTDWLRGHIQNRTSAFPDWSKAALMCHSASCDDTLMMIDERPSYVQASIFLDPVSIHSVSLKPILSKVKALTYLSQLSEELPRCCIPGIGWKKIYDLMTCTKVRMEVKDFGHCDLLEHSEWEVCHLTHFCKTTNDTRLAAYRSLTTGVIHGFLQWTLMGDKTMQKYITDPSNIPLPLVDIAFNTTCVN